MSLFTGNPAIPRRFENFTIDQGAPRAMPILKDEVKASLLIPFDRDDAIIDSLIRGVYGVVSRYTNRIYMCTPVIQYQDVAGDVVHIRRRGRIVGDVAIDYLATRTATTWTTINPSAYRVSPHNGRIYMLDTLPPLLAKQGFRVTATLGETYIPISTDPGYNAAVTTARAAMASNWPQVLAAMQMWVGYLYENRVGDPPKNNYAEDTLTLKDMPQQVYNMLQPYVDWAVVA